MALTDDDLTLAQGAFCPSCGEPAGNGRFCSGCGTAIPVRMGAVNSSSLTANTTGGDAEVSTTVPPPATAFMPPPESAEVPPTVTMPTAVAGVAPPVGPPPAAAPPAYTPPPATPPTSKPGGHSRMLLLALAALGLVAAAVAVVILTTHGRGAAPKRKTVAGPSASAIYRGKLRTALTPLVAANQTLSGRLGSMSPSQSNVTSAKSAASATQTALATARGAVGALAAPASSRTVSQQVQQAFDDESGYVQAVSATLANPDSSQASQLQTLATSLQSSLVPLDSISSGASASVSGTSSLTSWANGASTRAKAAHHHSSGGSSGSGGSSSSSSSSSSTGSGVYDPYANGENCGGGIFAGPNTSCPFAENVYEAWSEAIGDTVTVQAYSPVTNETYAMNCAPAGNGITCTGGINASVSWSLG